jgi:hypothetical protein
MALAELRKIIGGLKAPDPSARHSTPPRGVIVN